MFWRLGEVKSHHLLLERTAVTVEAGDDHLPGVWPSGQQGRLSSREQLAAVFDEAVMPSVLQQQLRQGYFAAWKMVLAWGVAHEEVGALLPMTQTTQRSRASHKRC